MSSIQISAKHRALPEVEYDISASLAASRSCVKGESKEEAVQRTWETKASELTNCEGSNYPTASIPVLPKVPSQIGTTYVAYIGPAHESGNFPGQEIHCGFISTTQNSRLELQGALRYSKFSTTFPKVDHDEWTRFWSLASPFERCEIGPKMFSIVLPNNIYGRIFDRLFAKNLNPSFAAATDELRDAISDGAAAWSWSCRIL